MTDIGARRLLAGSGALLVTVVMVVLAMHAARAQETPNLSAATTARAACATHTCPARRAVLIASVATLITRAGSQARSWGQQVSAMTRCTDPGSFGSLIGAGQASSQRADGLARVLARCAAGVRVSGNEVVDGAGVKLRLRGVVRSGTEYMCSEGYGMFDGPTLSAEFAPMVNWKINTVFIGLNEDCWLGINGAGIANWSANSGARYVNAIKAEVKSAESYGMYPAIGLFWGDPGHEVPHGSDPNGGGQPPLPDNDHSPLFWEEVAHTFIHDPNVILRLQEEPHPDDNSSGPAAWTCWAKGDVQYDTTSDRPPPIPPTPVGHSSHCAEKGTDGLTPYQTVGMQSLINVIRGTGATNVIQVPGVSYANMTSCGPTVSPSLCGVLDTADGIEPTDPANPSHPQLMMDLDMYPDTGQNCKAAECYDATIAPVATTMPVDLGEIGPNGTADTQSLALLDWADAHDLGYYAWNWDTWGNVIKDYTGAPTTTFGQNYFDRVSGTTPPPPAQPTNGMIIRQTVPGVCVDPPNAITSLKKPVRAGDDLFIVIGGQGYGGPAPVVSAVTDKFNGAWTKLTETASETIDHRSYTSYAVYELSHSKAAPNGLTISLTATPGQSGMSSAVIDIGGVASTRATAFTTAPNGTGNGVLHRTAFTGATLNGAQAGDLVLGLFASFSHNYQTFTAPRPYHTSPAYWTTSQNCAAAAIDWTQPRTTADVSPTLVSNSTEFHYAGAIDLQP
jgi:endoglucanase